MNIDPEQVFSALANGTRLRCLFLVAVNEDVCVCEVVAALGLAQPTASKSLNMLKTAGLLIDRREGNWNYFSLNPDMPRWLAQVVKAVVSEMAHTDLYRDDQMRLKELDLRATSAA